MLGFIQYNLQCLHYLYTSTTPDLDQLTTVIIAYLLLKELVMAKVDLLE